MRIAITGGIGSGKSYVCKRLESYGISVYDCDAAAKRLMRTSSSLKRALCQLVGEDIYINNVLQKQVLAKFLLASEANKQAVNDVVHPAVALDFEESDFNWLESAILFDSGFDQRVHFDCIVCVTAPLEVRIQRVMHRDGITREKTLEWISRQMSQSEMVKRSNFEIVNDNTHSLDSQIQLLLKSIRDFRKLHENNHQTK